MYKYISNALRGHMVKERHKLKLVTLELTWKDLTLIMSNAGANKLSWLVQLVKYNHFTSSKCYYGSISKAPNKPTDEVQHNLENK